MILTIFVSYTKKYVPRILKYNHVLEHINSSCYKKAERLQNTTSEHNVGQIEMNNISLI